jgi:hypothetical protein
MSFNDEIKKEKIKACFFNGEWTIAFCWHEFHINIINYRVSKTNDKFPKSGMKHMRIKANK